MSSAVFSENFYNSYTHDLAALEKDVEEYPFSSLAQYMLLCRYKKVGHADYENSARRTASYFTNPHWLQFQLARIEADSREKELHHQYLPPDGIIDTNSDNNHFAIATQEELDPGENDSEMALDETIPKTGILGDHVAGLGDMAFADEPKRNEEETALPGTGTLGMHIDVPSGETQRGSSAAFIQNENFDAPETESLGSHDEANQETSKDVFQPGGQDTVQEDGADFAANNTGISVSETQDVEPGPGISNAPFNEVKQDQSEAGQGKPGNDQGGNDHAEEPIAFEPMHTVDYFASQGIKVPDEPFTNNKLGTQMKSFTEWLKSMKKVHPRKLEQENTLADDIIKSAAEVSNIDTEVLTEAMAEVLIKQDKREKAIEMYSKLSLINPSKSAYFAAKIESIKSS